MRFLKSWLFVPLFFFATTLDAQIPSQVLQQVWKAYWIAVPGEPAHGYGVYHFRKELTLAQKPASFVVHVSADNRYKLFVNETQVSLGPARGDITHWNFETVDLAPYLKTGTNVLAAVIWNEGESRPEAQISYRTGFILQGNSAAEEEANTNSSWKGMRDSSYKPLMPQLVYSFYVTGPGEAVDLRLTSDNWMRQNFIDTTWKSAQQVMNGLPKGVFAWQDGSWMLVPRAIPPMERTTQRLQAVRSADGITVPDGFPQQKKSSCYSSTYNSYLVA